MERDRRTGWVPDATQEKVIDAGRGCHLVLAPPGCGKTQILAERIRRAHARGVAYEDMLCLTFTNRAARGMRDRIADNVAEHDAGGVFVGNVHRFCSQFLFQNGVVPVDSAIIDDDTMNSILAMYLNEDEERALANSERRRFYSQIMFLSHLMYELRHDIPKPLRLHPECVSKDDVTVMRAICQMRNIPFTAEAMTDIYEHTDYYLELVRSEGFDMGLRLRAEQLVMRMRYAHAYEAYKHQNNLLDFEDLLQQTYVALRDDHSHKRYPWIQVDEVQDLNRLQLAIIDALGTCRFDGSREQPKDAASGTIMYLGDEMQAIFSFMGAKLQMLELLRDRCRGRLHHLGINHRSPKYLVELLNAYAVMELNLSSELLPESKNECMGTGKELMAVSSEHLLSEYIDVTSITASLYKSYPCETTAIIVNSNKDADEMSRRLEASKLKHFKISGTDLFSTPEMKLLIAHMSVLACEHNFLAWSRLMAGLGVCRTNASARRFVHELEMRAISPTDLLYESESTYVQAFLRVYNEQDIVVFDTETTGLNVYEDDVVQIAAERIRNGRTVAKFSVHIATDKEIPQMLGEVPNPIIEERRHHTIRSHEEGLQMFLDFAAGQVLIAHNAEYDYHIMEHNLRRYLPHVDWHALHPIYFDSLKLIRLLRPDMKTFKLKALLSNLHLEGNNSHLADEDVSATVSLLQYCRLRSQELVASQKEYISRKNTQERIRILRRNYEESFSVGHGRLYERGQNNGEPALVLEMRRFYKQMIDEGRMRYVAKIEYVFRFLADDVVDTKRTPSLMEQLSRHITELNTFKEADLCGASAIDERIFVSTIHKAKGLEFDNVIVFDVVDGRIPNYYSLDNEQDMAEDARKLYVAMSRARRRLFVSYRNNNVNVYESKSREISRFLQSVLPMFTCCNGEQCVSIIQGDEDEEKS